MLSYVSTIDEDSKKKQARNRHAVVEMIYIVTYGQALQEWAEAPTAKAYADGQISVPSA
jgi:hypothetical protein